MKPLEIFNRKYYLPAAFHLKQIGTPSRGPGSIIATHIPPFLRLKYLGWWAAGGESERAGQQLLDVLHPSSTLLRVKQVSARCTQSEVSGAPRAHPLAFWKLTARRPSQLHLNREPASFQPPTPRRGSINRRHTAAFIWTPSKKGLRTHLSSLRYPSCRA